MVEPTVVHCSAGIGRTGVLILMETAQCLIEANEPVYPLDVVRAMRDQRAMMIQTAVSIHAYFYLIVGYIIDPGFMPLNLILKDINILYLSPVV